MHDLRTIDIPKITDGEKFEYLCRDLMENDNAHEHVSLNGRSGQKQSGVDVFGRIANTGEWFGVQCKCRSTGKTLSRSDIQKEINSAKSFNPSITKFYIYTTLDRCAKVQELERSFNDQLSNENSFSLRIVFWQEIEEKLKLECNFNVYYRYYQKFFADNTKLGHSIGKIFNLDLYFDDVFDTHYEVMLGKIPEYKNAKHKNVNYYRGTYFIVNFHECNIETFTVPCHDVDLIQAFPNQIDRHRVVKWLNSINDLEHFICTDEVDFTYSLCTAERIEFNEDQY